MKAFNLIWALGICAVMALPGLAQADPVSTNYTLTDHRFTAGGGDALSTNYQVAETSFDMFAGDSLTSTNYAQESMKGISGGKGIASINSITPADLHKYYSDELATCTVDATSQDGDTLQYKVAEGITVKDGPQTSNALSWTLQTSDQGRHTMTISVIDPDGTTIQNQTAYVVRRPTK